ncbi:glycosyltransferase [Aeribacillus sp. FSL K6-3256]|jgi:glycosyltransferase involved in cell wall biosynthesis|uniref:glycosyltransferase n=1 Tax=Aeribacillus TaxID=1055323 RepID=UPI0030CC872A
MDLTDLLRQIRTKKGVLLNNIKDEIQYLEKNFGVVVNLNISPNVDNINSTNKNEYIELRDKFADINFVNEVKNQKSLIPASNGSSFFEKFNVNIGIIADEFLFNSFKDIANFYYVHREKYHELEGKLDILLIATAWKGLENDWKGLGNPKISKVRKDIFQVIDFFKKQGVKIVFYSKEDPTNYEYFVDIAQKCDYIFTTAAEKVDDYKRDCKNNNVFVLEFGVNPVYNNPIGITSVKKYDGALFAGSWYNKYPHRQHDTTTIFDGVIEAGHHLKIIDRNYWLNLEQYFFPVKYLKYISPSMEHEDLQSLLKMYIWAINLNTVKYSESMFANRVFEMQAMGNLILSNYSLGMNFLFPNIFIVHDKEEVKFIMNSLTDIELYMLQMDGVRKVLREHTTFHRISYLLQKIGFQQFEIPKRTVAVVANEKNKHILDSFERQTYPYKKLVTIDELTEDNNFDYITFFNEKYFYGEYYLEDLVNGFKYTNSSYITKDSYYKDGNKVSGVENNYINIIRDKYRTVFDVKKFNVNDLLSLEGELECENGYSIDSLEISENDQFRINIEKQDYKFSVIIPVYNNGEHLYGKCFMSLRRSSMFKNMEIIIVDDGSTDDRTIKIVQRLERLYDNVNVYRFNDGGSGSASRPRNKGIELATTNYITFLDPDNEAVNDGYYELYKILSKNDYDLVVGDIKKLDTKTSNFDYYKSVVKLCNGKTEFEIKDSKEFLKQTFFKAQSIQALMVKKDLLIKNNLKMIPGAIGEDTLFYFQLITNAKKFKVIDKIIHIYYAGVKGSTVNSINLNFFKKYQSLEKEKYNYLKVEGLIEDYINVRFNYYFKNWYLEKLKKINPEERDEAIKILRNILNIYLQDIDIKKIDPEILNTLKVGKKRIFAL